MHWARRQQQHRRLRIKRIQEKSIVGCQSTVPLILVNIALRIPSPPSLVRSAKDERGLIHTGHHSNSQLKVCHNLPASSKMSIGLKTICFTAPPAYISIPFCHDMAKPEGINPAPLNLYGLLCRKATNEMSIDV